MSAWNETTCFSLSHSADDKHSNYTFTAITVVSVTLTDKKNVFFRVYKLSSGCMSDPYSRVQYYHVCVE